MSDNAEEYQELLLATDRQAVFENQLEFLQVEFQARTTIIWEGHRFLINLNLLQWADWALSEHDGRGIESVIVLDQEQVPVLIESIPDFHDHVHTVFHEALNDYYDKYTNLKGAKTVKEIVDAI